MTRTDLLTRCRRLGIDLFAEPGGELGWEADDDLPGAVVRELRAHKLELLALLPPPWDRTEADRLLHELRSTVAKLKAGSGRKLTAPLARLLDDAVVIGERFIRDRVLEARRGWDSMGLLRDLLPHVRNIVANWKKRHDA